MGGDWEVLPATVILIWVLLKTAQADAGVLTRGRLVLLAPRAAFFHLESARRPGGDRLTRIVSAAPRASSTMVDCPGLRACDGRAARGSVGGKKPA